MTYQEPIQRILEASCVGCHKPGLTPPDLSTYATAAAAARTSLVSIQAQSMPPAVPLAADQALAFKLWVDAGAPETLASSTGTKTSTTTSPDIDPQTDEDTDDDDTDDPQSSDDCN